MKLSVPAIQTSLSLICLLLIFEVAACPPGKRSYDHATNSLEQLRYKEDLARQFDASLASSNRTLGIRNIITPGGGRATLRTSAQLFELGQTTVPGNCVSQSNTLDAWIAEAYQLQVATETAVATWSTDIGIRLLIWFYLGVEFDLDAGVMLSGGDNFYKWSIIEARIAGVSKFLTGNGLAADATLQPPVAPPSYPGNGYPWIFCDGEFAELATYDGVAKDVNGNDVLEDIDTTTTPPTKYYKTVGDLFNVNKRATGDKGVSPYYVRALGSYIFDHRTFSEGLTSYCGNPTRVAVTSRAQASDLAMYVGWQPVTIGYPVRQIRMCPGAFTRVAGTLHSAPSLASALDTANYPRGSAGDRKLDTLVSISGTFYHELYHLTAGAAGIDAPDILNTDGTQARLLDLLKLSIGQKGISPDIRLVHNPESYTLFAMAVYIYLNPPSGQEAMLLVGDPGGALPKSRV